MRIALNLCLRFSFCYAIHIWLSSHIPIPILQYRVNAYVSSATLETIHSGLFADLPHIFSVGLLNRYEL
jgi:hypothetical protein